MDYNNPFGAFNTNYGGAGQQGFVNQTETMETSEKNEMARPFIDMAKQSAGLDLQKKQLESDEFGSPDAKMERAKAIQLKVKQHDAEMERVNPQLRRDLQKIEQEIQLSPFEMDAKKAQAIDTARLLKGKPISEFINEAADWGNAFGKSKLDPLIQAIQYKAFIKGFEDRHPDTKIPPNMTNWSENLGKYLSLAKMQSLYSTAHEQAMQKEEADNASKERVAKGNNAATLGSAAITAEARSRDVAATIEGKEQTAEQKALDHVQTSVDKARQNIFMIGLGLPPKEKQQAQKEYIEGVRKDAMDNYESIVGKSASSAKVSEFQTKATEAWGAFEPSKYIYGTNPKTGKFARQER